MLSLGKDNVIYSDIDHNNMTDGGFEFRIGTKGQLVFGIWLGGAGTTFWWMEKESPKDLVGTNTHQMVGVAYDRIHYRGRFFLNGSSRGTGFWGKPAYYDARGSYVYLCGSPRHVGSCFQGYISDLALSGLANPAPGGQWYGGTLANYAEDAQHRMWRFCKYRYGL